jgi:hypothetical protein
MNTTKEGKEMKLPSVPCKNARQRVATHGKGIVAVPAALPCAFVASLPWGVTLPCAVWLLYRAGMLCRVPSCIFAVRLLFAVRRSPAARQSCHCRARGARQRAATRQRVEEAHGKEARTAVRLFPVVRVDNFNFRKLHDGSLIGTGRMEFKRPEFFLLTQD